MTKEKIKTKEIRLDVGYELEKQRYTSIEELWQEIQQLEIYNNRFQSFRRKLAEKIISFVQSPNMVVAVEVGKNTTIIYFV